MAEAQGFMQQNGGYAILRTLLEEMQTNCKTRLAELLRQKSLVQKELTLSAGQRSNYYFDCKLTTLDPEGAFLTGFSVLQKLDEMQISPQAIGGLTMGADPIVSATVVASHLEKRPLPGFLIRKERKGHGLGKQIEGIDSTVRNVVIVDEVCTTGKSTQEAIDIALEEGYNVVAVISLVDREEGGSAALKKKYHYGAIFTARELMAQNEQSSETTGDSSQLVNPGASFHR